METSSEIYVTDRNRFFSLIRITTITFTFVLQCIKLVLYFNAKKLLHVFHERFLRKQFEIISTPQPNQNSHNVNLSLFLTLLPVLLILFLPIYNNYDRAISLIVSTFFFFLFLFASASAAGPSSSKFSLATQVRTL
jgi:hypothetical protein